MKFPFWSELPLEFSIVHIVWFLKLKSKFWNLGAMRLSLEALVVSVFTK